MEKLKPSKAVRDPLHANDTNHYHGVADAITYLVEHRGEQPDLTALAANAGLSPSHFQRVFKAAVGVSPKRFLQFLTASDARQALDSGRSVLEAALDAGLSGPSRLHDLFLVTQAMTPGTYKRKGEGLSMRYGIAQSPFGQSVIAATDTGISWLGFCDGDDPAFEIDEMKADWPAAAFHRDDSFAGALVTKAFAAAFGGASNEPVGLHVQGTNFQIKVWEALLKIPAGSAMTYGDVAQLVGAPRAARAVGSAVGANMISLLIPCHRVILSTGVIHQYRWGVDKKRALLAAEWAGTESRQSASV